MYFGFGLIVGVFCVMPFKIFSKDFVAVDAELVLLETGLACITGLLATFGLKEPEDLIGALHFGFIIEALGTLIIFGTTSCSFSFSCLSSKESMEPYNNLIFIRNIYNLDVITDLARHVMKSFTLIFEISQFNLAAFSLFSIIPSTSLIID